MHIGEPLRSLTVEPVVSPVPDGDVPGRFAEVRPAPTRPTPRAEAAVPDHEPESPTTSSRR